MKNKQEKSVDAYLDAQQPAIREKLQELREIILSACPDAEEVLSYGVPCYKYHYMLVSMGATKNRCSFYGMSTVTFQKFGSKLSEYRPQGGTLHFDPAKKLPTVLIRNIVKERMKENAERAAKKASKK